MKNLFFIIVITFIPVLLCGCSFSGNSHDEVIEYSFSEDIKPASPVVTPTHEERTENTRSLLKSAMESMDIMDEMAEKDSASEDGVKAAEAVHKKYKSRLEDLDESDLSALSDDELTQIALEISDMITAIREARDLLQ